MVPWNKPSHLKDCTSASGFSLIQVTTAIITPTHHARYIIYIVYVFYVAPPSVDTYQHDAAVDKNSEIEGKDDNFTLEAETIEQQSNQHRTRVCRRVLVPESSRLCTRRHLLLKQNVLSFSNTTGDLRRFCYACWELVGGIPVHMRSCHFCLVFIYHKGWP